MVFFFDEIALMGGRFASRESLATCQKILAWKIEKKIEGKMQGSRELLFFSGLKLAMAIQELPCG